MADANLKDKNRGNLDRQSTGNDPERQIPEGQAMNDATRPN